MPAAATGRAVAVLLSICAALTAAQAGADSREAQGEAPVEVLAGPVRFAALNPGRERFGSLAWRGGLRLLSDDPRFGGFSGLRLSGDGRWLVAVSDDGWWLKARIIRKDGRLSGLADPVMAPLLAADGRRPPAKRLRDAEAVADYDGRSLGGRLIVAYERQPRLELFDLGAHGLMALPEPLGAPAELLKGPSNGEVEAIDRFHEGPRRGDLIAISEDNLDAQGRIRGWVWNDASEEAFVLERHGDYDVTDMAILPGALAFVTVERSYSPPLPPGLALRRFMTSELAEGAVLRGELLFEGRQPLYLVDNMEGIAAHRTADGEVRLTLISDDNYNRKAQRTLIIEFAIAP